MNIKTVLRWGLILASVLAVGPLCSTAMASVRDADGGHAVSIFVGGGGARNVLAGVMILGGAALVGWIGAHFFALSTGFGCSGVVLAWGAWRTGTLDDVVRRSHGGEELSRVAVECAIVMIVVIAIAAMMWLASRKKQPGGVKSGEHASGWLGMLASSKEAGNLPKVAGVCVVVGAAACGVIAWICASTMLKGQAVFAAFVGAIAAGVAAQFAASSMRGHATPVSVVVSMLIPAIVGPLLASQLNDGEVVAQTYANTIVPLARVMPLDWAAGALLGAPIGLGWAGAMVDARVV